MERKAKITQAAVNTACDKLHSNSKPVTVNAVITAIGGSFSTVGPMVKRWKEEQAKQTTALPELPDTVMAAMHKAVADLWTTASSIAGETVERIQCEASEAIAEAKTELQEYTGEVTRLEKALEQAQKANTKTQSALEEALGTATQLATEKTALEARLSDRDTELHRLRDDYEKLQKELVAIAKAKK
jgi:predicted nuclease with TOPRIM domain